MLVLAFSTSSCRDDLDTLEPNIQATSNTGRIESDSLYLGEQLQNPYSVTNMTAAWQTVQQEYPQLAIYPLQLSPTHLYVKFSISTRQELTDLEEDSTLILYEYPLDYEMLGSGEYHAPEVPEGEANFFYASVSVDKVQTLPANVNYQVLEQLFIPDEVYNDDNTYQIGSLSVPEELVDALVDEVLSITGNLEEEATGGRIEGSKWRPAGNISAFDNQTNGNTSIIPVEGVMVHARRWFTTKKGRTDANGDYSCNGRFKRKANYSIRWQTKDFKLTRSAISPFTAIVNGPKKKGDWNRVIIGGTSISYLRVHVFRAAYYYYNKDIHGLRKPPPRHSTWGRLQIATIDKSGGLGDHGKHLGKSIIRIWNNGRESCRTYGTTIHELAHASHAHLDTWNYNNQPRINSGGEQKSIVNETWARGVEMELTPIENIFYRTILDPYEELYARKTYTGLVQDLINPASISVLKASRYYSNSNATYTDSWKKYTDRVTGYTIRQIEDALIGAGSWHEWRNNLKNHNQNDTEEYLYNLFLHWNSGL